MKRPSRTFIIAATLLATATVTASPALAGGHGHDPGSSIGRPHTIAEGLLTPLSLAVDGRGRALVSQNFRGELVRFTRGGQSSTIATSPGDELGAVSTSGSTIYWASTGQDPTAPSATLYSQGRHGTPRVIADLRAYEASANPDQDTTYGFRGLPESCAAQFPADNPAVYRGAVDSHPYATSASRGQVFVADAGANAILAVRTGRSHSRVRTVAVLPPVTAQVSATALQAQGLPTCAAGRTYYFESVPTDVERGRDGWLYVSLLPGGPEDASLGARGAVVKVDPSTGDVRAVAGGFVGAVDLALGPDGTIAVAELFGGANGAGQVTLVSPRSSHRRSLPLTSPGAVEWVGSKRHSTLYVTTDAFGGGAEGPQPVGRLQTVRISSHHH
ncbi:ScyD/ScyE family protein [Aeromicrobium sp. CFBP 8757]|uniref:ScyD/ScyE family protein n=1 Tax=Aeromicrobium sp. CFBP 8757 TaxID=2775288 RepID=UPI00177FB411|nr:ScyD/ScyE family protein [Aeromicrobium sp. CFBP 8757]MBD8608692.1 ScyD/ScyE family protein [Aeromicrobium sp. CFBP 8757]